MAKYIKYDEKGDAYDEYPLSKLKKLLKSKNSNLRYTAETVIGWEKAGRESRIKKSIKQKMGYSMDEIMRM